MSHLYWSYPKVLYTGIMNAGGGCLTIANQAEEQSDGSGAFF